MWQVRVLSKWLLFTVFEKELIMAGKAPPFKKGSKKEEASESKSLEKKEKKAGKQLPNKKKKK